MQKLINDAKNVANTFDVSTDKDCAVVYSVSYMPSEKNKELLLQARNGYLNRVKAEEVTKDRFEQSIRKGFSQEMACEIAEARFAQSTDLAHSVGAVKELMLTHETRSLRWKILHPIKNYRENATISDLTKRLSSDKKFSSTQIANEFVRESNSFAMDWGKSLSNDHAAIQFEQDNEQRFQKTAEHMMLDVLKKNYSDQIKDATPQNESSVKMMEELQKVISACKALGTDSTVICSLDVNRIKEDPAYPAEVVEQLKQVYDAQLEQAVINSVLTSKVMRLIRDAADVAEV